MFMKKSVVFFFVFAAAVLTSCGKEDGSSDPSNPEPQGLSLQEATEARAQIVEAWRSEQASLLQPGFNKSKIEQNGVVLKFRLREFGSKPADGRSLWISLHGGGGTTSDVNNSQWANQQTLYKPDEGIYLCPRAPWDSWDMWFKAPIDSLFEELITTLVVLRDVNPDKVYVMGYSAGGDGVWRLAPRLADHWAAAAMMAGHPGDVSLLNVRNLPFTIWVGENDDAYNRNTEVAKRGEELDSLQNADPEGYIHECHVVQGKEHWMDLEDAAAVPWMAQYRRNPYPNRIVWRQEEVVRRAFYWLRAPADELQRGNKVIVETSGNTINIEHCDYSSITLLLNDNIVDLDKVVTVIYNGKTLFSGRLARSRECLEKTLAERNDIRYMFDCELSVNIPK